MRCKSCKNKSIKFGYCLKCWDELTPDFKIKTIEYLVSTNTTKTENKRRDGDFVPPGVFTVILSMGVYPLVLMSNNWLVVSGVVLGLIGIALMYNKFYEKMGKRNKKEGGF